MSIIGEFNLTDIIKQQINFNLNNTIFQRDEAEVGELNSLNEMLLDMPILSVEQFTEKYLGITSELKKTFELLNNEQPPNIDKLDYYSGYNNGIINILKLINPIYLYDLE